MFTESERQTYFLLNGIGLLRTDCVELLFDSYVRMWKSDYTGSDINKCWIARPDPIFSPPYTNFARGGCLTYIDTEG